MSGINSWEPPHTHNPTNRHTCEEPAAHLQMTRSYSRVCFLAQEMWVKTGESRKAEMSRKTKSHGMPEQRGLQRFSGPTNSL